MNRNRTFCKFYMFSAELRVRYFRLAEDTEKTALMIAALDSDVKVLSKELKKAKSSLKK